MKASAPSPAGRGETGGWAPTSNVKFCSIFAPQPCVLPFQLASIYRGAISAALLPACAHTPAWSSRRPCKRVRTVHEEPALLCGWRVSVRHLLKMGSLLGRRKDGAPLLRGRGKGRLLLAGPCFPASLPSRSLTTYLLLHSPQGGGPGVGSASPLAQEGAGEASDSRLPPLSPRRLPP